MSMQVLVGSDGSDQSERAIEYAMGMADADVTVITVVNPFDTDPLSPGYQSPLGKSGVPAYSEEWYEKEWENVREFHAEMQDEYGDFESVIKMGDPAKKMLEYVEEHDVDHIVVGSSSKGRIQQALMGSVAETIARRSPVNVTLIR